MSKATAALEYLETVVRSQESYDRTEMNTALRDIRSALADGALLRAGVGAVMDTYGRPAALPPGEWTEGLQAGRQHVCDALEVLVR